MGKKGKKTRWRELPITLADKPYAGPAENQQPSGRHSAATVGDSKPVNFAAAAGRRSHYTTQQQQPHHQRHQSSNDGPTTNGQQHHHHTETSTVTFNEDEYTKITTPRQDVLFKKGYLGRRKHVTTPAVIAEALNENEDGVPIDTIVNPLDELCAQNEYFVDSSGIYILNGGGYEVYDPYTGNVTVLMGPPPPYPPGHPMLTAMSYQPMPLQPLDWYSPANHLANEHWMSGATSYQPNGSRHHHKKSTPAVTDAQQNCNSTTQNSETGANVAQDSFTDGDQQQNSLYQSPFVYPAGYVFGAPVYNNYNGVNVQVPQPQSPPSPSISCSDYTNGKRRKKKKRRKRGGVNDEYSDSSSEEQKSQSGASSDHVMDSEKTSDSGVLTNNSGGSTPVNVIPVQLSHSAPPFHMECPQPFEILHGTPFLVHPHHPDHQMATYYQPIPQYHHHNAATADQLQQQAPIGYQVIPEEQPVDEVADDHQQNDVEPAAASYSAENSDSGISSPNSEVMVKGVHQPEGKLHEKPQATDGGCAVSEQTTNTTTTTTTASKKSRNRKSKQREKVAAVAESTATKAKSNAGKDPLPKNHHEPGSKKSSKIAKEPAIIKKLNAAKKGKSHNSKQEPDKPDTIKSVRECQPTTAEVDNEDDDNDEVTQDEIIHQVLSINSEAGEWIQEEVFCSLECTPRSTTTDHVQFKFTKTQSVDSCESVEEETFATAVNTGNSDTENEIRQDEPPPPQPLQTLSGESTDPESSPEATVRTVHTVSLPGPITEAVTKWLNDQGGLMLAPCLDDDDDDIQSDTDDNDEDGDSEYGDFDEHPTSPKNVRGNPYPALSRSGGEGSRVAGTQTSHDQRKSGIISSGICCLTQ